MEHDWQLEYSLGQWLTQGENPSFSLQPKIGHTMGSQSWRATITELSKRILVTNLQRFETAYIKADLDKYLVRDGNALLDQTINDSTHRLVAN